MPGSGIVGVEIMFDTKKNNPLSSIGYIVFIYNIVILIAFGIQVYHGHVVSFQARRWRKHVVPYMPDHLLHVL
jgi:hypothetical protein